MEEYSKTSDISTKSTDKYSTANKEHYWSMKWYKALLVFLIFGIFSNVISAIMYFTGSMYDNFTEKIYALLPALKQLDSYNGYFCLFIAFFTLIVWIRLKKFKKHAPALLIIIYILNIAFLIFYMYKINSIIGSLEDPIIYGNSYISGMYQYQEYLDLSKLAFSPTYIVSILTSIVMCVANIIYFRHRKHLFVN